MWTHNSAQDELGEIVASYDSTDRFSGRIYDVNDCAEEEATELKEVGVCKRTENKMNSGKEGNLKLICFSNSCEMSENTTGNATGYFTGNLIGNAMGNSMGNAMGNLRTILSQNL